MPFYYDPAFEWGLIIAIAGISAIAATVSILLLPESNEREQKATDITA